MATSAMATPLSLPIASPGYKSRLFHCFRSVDFVVLLLSRNLALRPVISALSSSYGDSSLIEGGGLLCLHVALVCSLQGAEAYVGCLIKDRSVLMFIAKLVVLGFRIGGVILLQSNGVIEAKKGNPPIMPAVMTPGGPLDLSTMYLNCPGGSTYSVLAIYDCMSWIKPKVGTVCFGVAASQGALLLAGGEKGMRYAMPNARIMIHQPQSGCGGHVEDVRRQVNEAVQSRHKIDKMYAAFTGQPLEKVQQFTERDRFLSVSEAMEFGLIDGVLETEY
ncbi:ATP-dependent Clp protease proteolytic subunit, chloroplastic [Sesamum angolense]|uniref:ATP-dependent Clp protease proteolytic subunit n=1 Tax=Sesamum angolense TaxID=2727404 RepID=A0AAE1X9I8_9LAMI|nr:ATP-dependent Clp protease proteolytic subunit, chloroplastic [Sesamum angolense]